MKSSFIIFSHLNLRAKNNTITDLWLKHRLSLLEHVSVASLRNQSDMNFLYVLAIAHDTSDSVQETVQKILKEYLPNNYELVFVTPNQTNYPCKNSALLVGDKGGKLLWPYIKPDALNHVFTTHIGTDDAVSKNFVNCVRTVYDWVEYPHHGFINFSGGYVCMSRTQDFHLINDQNYFFLTLREPIEKFKSVLYAAHSRIHRIAPVLRPPSSNPMWIKVIHENQIGNYSQWSHTFRKKIVQENIDSVKVLKYFDINAEVITSSCN